MNHLIKTHKLTKTFEVGKSCFNAVDGVSLKIDAGELVVIVGPSGSGKTTLLNMLGGIDKPTSGKIFYGRVNIAKYSDKDLLKYRKNDVGFVFQFYNLIQNLTVFENIDIVAKQNKKSKEDTINAIKMVGLEDRMKSFPAHLSGGEQQRVAIARAIIKEPKLLLCDEPTGALDFLTGKQVLTILQSLANKGQTVVIITHNSAILDIADKAIIMRGGKIKSEYYNENPLPASKIEW